MTITSINTGQPSTPTTATRDTPRNSLGDLGQADFLKLMMTQLQQQDPFEPMDQTAMLAQMAQFSSLAGTTAMGDTLTRISAQMETLNQTGVATQRAVAALATQVEALNAASTSSSQTTPAA
ncbi:flagellar hook assembly protein FlgD [Novosphingobium sp. BW1]|uniref:flagellar hook assembly protein FlgD n=1 Tax=Novosphingobium sp. BW1 TaxID=2592621 RepID=UPI0011DE5DBB|nr:flagellar hook capping FlgD N-terminal domain-containing protein [Novosphingobium sp. BW1]TYC85239.1 flagellar biosynthesis protein FlgD [Novosphingobium sp. BW1]